MKSPRQPGDGPALRRRGFVALGAAGGAAAVLAACGKEVPEPSSDRDVSLLSDALVGETNATSALGDAVKLAKGGQIETIKALRDQASANSDRVQAQLSKLNAQPSGEFQHETADSLNVALNTAIEQTNGAVEAYRTGAGLLTTDDLKSEAIQLAIADGARLAMLRQLLNPPQNEAPYAFVTGGTQPPVQSVEHETTSSTTSSTTSTDTGSSSTTSSGEGG
jgi:hypothetical protein